MENFISLFESPLLAPRPYSIACTSYCYLAAATPGKDFNPALSFLRPNLLALHTGSGICFVSLSKTLMENDAPLQQCPLLTLDCPLSLPLLGDIQDGAGWLIEDCGMTQRASCIMRESAPKLATLVSHVVVRHVAHDSAWKLSLTGL